MKNYYITISINYYTVVSDKDNGVYPITDSETYSLIISASSVIKAQENAKTKAIERLVYDVGDVDAIIKITFDECYRTSDEARL